MKTKKNNDWKLTAIIACALLFCIVAGFFAGKESQRLQDAPKLEAANKCKPILTMCIEQLSECNDGWGRCISIAKSMMGR